METWLKIQSEMWVPWVTSELSCVTRNFLASTSLTWNCSRSPACGTLHQPLPAWDEILALQKSLTNSWLALPRLRCSGVWSDAQEMRWRHESAT